jgi:hypothetical protein
VACVCRGSGVWYVSMAHRAPMTAGTRDRWGLGPKHSSQQRAVRMTRRVRRPRVPVQVRSERWAGWMGGGMECAGGARESRSPASATALPSQVPSILRGDVCVTPCASCCVHFSEPVHRRRGKHLRGLRRGGPGRPPHRRPRSAPGPRALTVQRTPCPTPRAVADQCVRPPAPRAIIAQCTPTSPRWAGPGPRVSGPRTTQQPPGPPSGRGTWAKALPVRRSRGATPHRRRRSGPGTQCCLCLCRERGQQA